MGLYYNLTAFRVANGCSETLDALRRPSPQTSAHPACEVTCRHDQLSRARPRCRKHRTDKQFVDYRRALELGG
jgi:hypothetical protein